MEDKAILKDKLLNGEKLVGVWGWTNQLLRN